MQVACSHLDRVFFQEDHQLHAPFKECLTGLEGRRHAARIFVHELLEPEQELPGHDVISVDLRIRCLTFVRLKKIKRCVDLGLQLLHLGCIDIRFLAFFHDVLNGRFPSNTSLSV